MGYYTDYFVDSNERSEYCWRTRIILNMVLTLFPFVVFVYFLMLKEEYVFIKIIVCLFISSWILGLYGSLILRN